MVPLLLSPLQEDKFQQHQTMHLTLQKLRDFVLPGAFISQTVLQQTPGETFLSKTDGRTFKAICSSPHWISSKLLCKNKMKGSVGAFLHHPWGYTWGMIKQRQNGTLFPQQKMIQEKSQSWSPRSSCSDNQVRCEIHGNWGWWFMLICFYMVGTSHRFWLYPFLKCSTRHMLPVIATLL